MLVADTQGGLTIFRRSGKATAALPSTNILTANTNQGDFFPRNILAMGISDSAKPSLKPAVLKQKPAPAAASVTCIVSTNANEGEGSLRTCLETISNGTTVTFDTKVFSVSKPATILLKNPLPMVDQKTNITIDASNAGVILDGGQLEGVTGWIFMCQIQRSWECSSSILTTKLCALMERNQVGGKPPER